MSSRTSSPRKGRLLLIIYLVSLMQVILPIPVMLTVRRFVDTDAGPPGMLPMLEYAALQVEERRSDPGAMQREASRVRERMGILLTLYQPDGSLLVTNETPAPALSRAQLERLERIPVADWSGLTGIIPLMEGGHLAAYARVSHTREFPAPHAGSLLTPLAIILSVLALIAMLCARALSSPLERLATAARQFGSGELGVRLGWRRRDEFGEVARAFDEMAERVTLLLHSERELMANISHELRTPLSRIRVALDIAEEGDPDVARESLAEIAEDLGELERLIEDVMTATRLDLAAEGSGRGVPPLRVEPVDVGALVEKAASRFNAVHSTRVVQLRVAEELPLIEADPALLRRVVDNLLDNAQKYSDPGSPIALEARDNGACVEMLIQDRGIGIEPGDIERLTTPFFRTDRSRTRTSGGVGLGLTLARRIVEAHGGELRFESTVGAGTKVRVTVPHRARADRTG